MILKSIKWTCIVVASSIIITLNKKQTETLGSLYQSPIGPYYTPDFYPNGTDLTLPLGTMRYWKFGNKKGNKVVLIHGISTGSSCYDKLARELADEGYHVLVYDIWGRGYSEAPPGLYNEGLYTTQLSLLLDHVGWDKTDVVGVSLGGAIATSFTAFYPTKVNRLVLIAPAGLMENHDLPLLTNLLKVPYLPDFILNQPHLKSIISIGIKKLSSSYHSSLSEKDEIIKKVTDITFYQFLHHPGFLNAFIRTLLDFPFTNLIERYKTVGQNNIPTLIIWGNQDKIVPFQNHKKVIQFIPQAKLIVFNQEGHDVLLSKWKSVNEKVKSFLSPL